MRNMSDSGYMWVPSSARAIALFEHLLVAIDRRSGSCRVAALGLRMACRLRARVTVLFVVATMGPDADPNAQCQSHKAVDTGDRVFRQIRRMAARAGVPCVCRYAFGRDVHAIVREAATTHHCDIVMFNAP